MKTKLLLLQKAFVMMLLGWSGNAIAQCNYSYNYPGTTGWTFNGTTLGISSNNFTFTATPCSTYNFAVYPLTACAALSDNNWCADIDFEYTSRGSGGVAHTILCFSENTNNSWNVNPNYTISTNDCIEMYINCPINAAAGTEQLFANSKDGNVWGTATGGYTIAAGNTYYLRLQRLSPTQGMISVFSSSARTTLVYSECFNISSTVTGLDVMQHGCIPQGWWTRNLTAKLRNLVVSEVTPGITGMPTGNTTCSGYTTNNLCVNTPCGVNSYTWSVPSGSTITSGQGTSCINVNWGSTSGTVTCTMTFLGSACNLVQNANITINQSPTANAGADFDLCCGTIWYLGNGAGTASGGTPPYSYSWSPTTHLSNPAIANPALDVCSLWSLGETITYTLTVTDANNCTATDVVVVQRPAVSCRIANPDLANSTALPEEMIIAPNPSEGSFTILFTSENVVRDIEIVDVLGQVVYSKTNISSTSVAIDLSVQPAGTYFIRCKENGQLSFKRVVLQ